MAQGQGMVLSRLHRFVTATAPQSEPPKPGKSHPPFQAQFHTIFWLSLSLLFAIYYAALGMRQAFQSAYVVQDDAREYVFWMQQFVNPDWFPNDLMAQYFKSITPIGYATLYQGMAYLGIDPLTFSKILPLFLGIILTIYGFGVSLQLFPLPIAGFISMQLLNQGLWLREDLASAAPRAFATPLLLAFLYYLLNGSWRSLTLIILLQALFYPLLLFISLGILVIRLVSWKNGRCFLEWRSLLRFLIIGGLGFLALLPYLLSSSQFGPTVTAAQALTMPELWPGGRHPFYHPNPWVFWLIGSNSGIVPRFVPPLVWLGFLLPILLKRSPAFPLANQVSPKIKILPQMAAVALWLYVAAHAVILKLFFPTRYTGHTWRIAIALAAGITFTLLLDAALRACQWRSPWHFKRIAVLALSAALTVAIVFYPAFFRHFPRAGYLVSREAALYEFLQQQPKDSMIATLAEEANNIPTFAQRSLLVGREYALPFHLGYYNPMRQRIIDLLTAQYSEDLNQVQAFIQRYGIDFWIVHRQSFQPDYLLSDQKRWLTSFQPAFTAAVNTVKQGKTPALARLTRSCRVLRTPQFFVLDARCIAKSSAVTILPAGSKPGDFEAPLLYLEGSAPPKLGAGGRTLAAKKHPNFRG
jgi:hypothetical protein